MAPTLSERLLNHALPAILLAYGIYYFMITILHTILVQRDPLAIFDFSEIREKAFARLWLAIAPVLPSVRSTGVVEALPSLLSTATGVVLELGPGNGGQVASFTNPDIRAVYGAEPVKDLHEDLRKSADAAGLQDKYHILTCGGQTESLVPALAKAGVLNEGMDGEDRKRGDWIGVFDTIVCVRVLCSVPQLEETAQTLFRLLRPGGTLIVSEHVVNSWQSSKGSYIGRVLQLIYTLMGWSFFMGNCHLQRDTAKALKNAGKGDDGWAVVALDSDSPWGTLPYITGVLVKKA
ncbi:MAG: hypothetical protein M1827_003737 [Pycnora praestabilis]|nr:MAG: hypothetical protein M1827_003737 [Pycnora praestabilis]